MIIAIVIAVLALLALFIVLGLYLKRTTTYKAIISGDAKSVKKRSHAMKVSYENNGFKVRL